MVHASTHIYTHFLLPILCQVYVDPLSDDDLHHIANTMFPQLAECTWSPPTPSPNATAGPLLQRMIAFNQALQRDVERGLVGRSGAPWEINLRDVFRWCELTLHLQGVVPRLTETSTSAAVPPSVTAIVSPSGEGTAAGDVDMDGAAASSSSSSSALLTQSSWRPEKTVMTAMVARFRTHADRAHVCRLYRDVFGVDVSVSGPARVLIGPNVVAIGAAVLPRRGAVGGDSAVASATVTLDAACFTPALHGHTAQLERVAQCVELAWPCLLVGPSASGAWT